MFMCAKLINCADSYKLSRHAHVYQLASFVVIADKVSRSTGLKTLRARAHSIDSALLRRRMQLLWRRCALRIRNRNKQTVWHRCQRLLLSNTNKHSTALRTTETHERTCAPVTSPTSATLSAVRLAARLRTDGADTGAAGTHGIRTANSVAAQMSGKYNKRFNAAGVHRHRCHRIDEFYRHAPTQHRMRICIPWQCARMCLRHHTHPAEVCVLPERSPKPGELLAVSLGAFPREYLFGRSQPWVIVSWRI